MALNLKNPEIEKLVTEVALLAGESKTEAIRRALLERKVRLQLTGNKSRSKAGLLEFLERSVWPYVVPGALGCSITQEEQDDMLGYGPGGQ